MYFQITAKSKTFWAFVAPKTFESMLNYFHMSPQSTNNSKTFWAFLTLKIFHLFMICFHMVPWINTLFKRFGAFAILKIFSIDVNCFLKIAHSFKKPVTSAKIESFGSTANKIEGTKIYDDTSLFCEGGEYSHFWAEGGGYSQNRRGTKIGTRFSQWWL